MPVPVAPPVPTDWAVVELLAGAVPTAAELADDERAGGEYGRTIGMGLRCCGRPTVMPEPLPVPALPTAVIVNVSWFAPVSTWNGVPTVIPVVLVTLMFVAPTATRRRPVS